MKGKTKKIGSFGVEFTTHRRVVAEPMTAGEAGKLNAHLASKPKNSKEFGFYVKEPIGNFSVSYWMNENTFIKSHIRTNMYTIGEAMILLMEGAILRRPAWPSNVFIRFDQDVEVGKEGKNRVLVGSRIALITLDADPVVKDKIDIVLEQWNPTQTDLFAKDFQTVNIDLKNLRSEKE